MPERLPFLPIDAPNFAATAFERHADVQRVHPWLARFSNGYVVHGYEATADLLIDDEHLAPGIGPIIDFYGVQGTMWARFMQELLTSTTGTVHSRLRKSVASAFTPKRTKQVLPLMRSVIGSLLDQWAPKGAFDFAEFASYFPVTVMCGLLGVSPEPVPRLRSAIEDHMSSLTMDLAVKPRFLHAWDELWDFINSVINEREAEGKRDPEALLDCLLDARDAGTLDDDELRFMLLSLFIAGYDTSKNQLTFIMRTLLDYPAVYERCAIDQSYCGLVVDEALRHTSIATPFREVTKSFVYNGEAFDVGDLLVFTPAFAGRDPAVFPQPERFDPERATAKRHLAFGRGPHICLGMHIARAQLQEGLHLIAQRIRHPRLDGGVSWKQFIGAWGMERLPIAFEWGVASDKGTVSAYKVDTSHILVKS